MVGVSLIPQYQRCAEEAVLLSIELLTQYICHHTIIPHWKKPDGSFVTPADYGVQFLIYSLLNKHCPEIPCVGEETLTEQDEHKLPHICDFLKPIYPNISPDDLILNLTKKASISDQFWLLDPIDGTEGFIKKKQFAVALALIQHGNPLIAIMGCPHTPHSFKLYSAARGMGATVRYDKEAPHILKPRSARNHIFCEATLAAKNQQHQTTYLLSHLLQKSSGERLRIHRAESQYKYAMVAEGSADFFVRYPYVSSKAKIWDHAPGAFLVEESGGVVSDLLGHPLNYTNHEFLQNHPVILASRDPDTHERTLKALHELIKQHRVYTMH